MTHTVRVARWLEGEGFPAATLVVSGVEQPALIGGRVVTYRENAQDTLEYTNERSAEEFSRRFHDIRTGGSRRGWQPF